MPYSGIENIFRMVRDKRVLITGSTGFIGANLVREFLKNRAKVYILTRATSNKWRINDILSKLVLHYQ